MSQQNDFKHKPRMTERAHPGRALSRFTQDWQRSSGPKHLSAISFGTAEGAGGSPKCEALWCFSLYVFPDFDLPVMRVVPAATFVMGEIESSHRRCLGPAMVISSFPISVPAAEAGREAVCLLQDEACWAPVHACVCLLISHSSRACSRSRCCSSCVGPAFVVYAVLLLLLLVITLHPVLAIFVLVLRFLLFFLFVHIFFLAFLFLFFFSLSLFFFFFFFFFSRIGTSRGWLGVKWQPTDQLAFLVTSSSWCVTGPLIVSVSHSTKTEWDYF